MEQIKKAMKNEQTIMRTTKETLQKLKYLKLHIELETNIKKSYSDITDELIEKQFQDLGISWNDIKKQ